MSIIFVYLLVFVSVCYLGCVVGLAIQCENCSALADAKQACLYIPVIMPIIIIEFIVYCMKNGKGKYIFSFLLMEGKSLIVLGCISKAIARQKEKAAQNREYTPKPVIANRKPILSTTKKVFVAAIIPCHG